MFSACFECTNNSDLLFSVVFSIDLKLRMSNKNIQSKKIAITYFASSSTYTAVKYNVFEPNLVVNRRFLSRAR